MIARMRPLPFWRRRLLVPVLVLLGANVVVFAAYTLPRTWQERSISSRTATLRLEVERLRRLAAEARTRTETAQANGRDVAQFYDKRLEPLEAMTSTMEDVGKTAKELGLKPARQSFKRENLKDGPLVRYVIQMPVGGNYRQVVSLLDRLERSSHFLTVDEVRLRERTESGGADLDVVMSAYFRAGATDKDAR